MKGMRLLVVVIVLSANCIYETVCHRFGYKSWEQKKWRKDFSSCAGHLQSPIRINSQDAIPVRMPALELIRYHDLLPGPLQLVNNGHSVSLSAAKVTADDYFAKITPYIFGGRLTGEYVLEGLHFHWGNRNNLGSEHIFNDIQYPLEMHIIHRNRRYANVSEALKHGDGLTVLAFFYQLNEDDNTPLSNIVRYLPLVEDYNASTQINETFPLASLLPPVEEMERFYTYRGSLTTPPCSEAVIWIIFPEAMPVSLSQMNKFRNLQADDKVSFLVNNYRRVQKVGIRRIFVRSLHPKGWRYNSSIPYSKWDWLHY